jgi:uncharacterized phage protein gp47/JayE
MAIITEDGVALPTLLETVSDNTALWSLKTGDIDVASSSAAGELIAIKSELDTRFNQDMANIFVANTVMASGNNLELFGERKGVYRKSNIPTVTVVSIAGVDGTIILSGTSFTCNANDEIFLTQYQVEIVGGVAQVAVSSVNYGVVCPALTLSLTSSIAGVATATNVSTGIVGYEIESDEDYRERIQLVGTELTHTKDGLHFALLDLNGVSFASVVDNNTDSLMFGEVLARYFSVVVVGGSNSDIAQTVYDFMQNGNPSFGETYQDVLSERGITYRSYFTRATEQSVDIVITITTDSNFNTFIGEGAIVDNIVTYINSLEIGETLYIQRVEALCFITGVTAVSLTLDGGSIDIVPNYKTKLATNSSLVTIV